jgi:hypothetical protein
MKISPAVRHGIACPGFKLQRKAKAAPCRASRMACAARMTGIPDGTVRVLLAGKRLFGSKVQRGKANEVRRAAGHSSQFLEFCQASQGESA